MFPPGKGGRRRDTVGGGESGSEIESMEGKTDQEKKEQQKRLQRHAPPSLQLTSEPGLLPIPLLTPLGPDPPPLALQEEEEEKEKASGDEGDNARATEAGASLTWEEWWHPAEVKTEEEEGEEKEKDKKMVDRRQQPAGLPTGNVDSIRPSFLQQSHRVVVNRIRMI